GEDVSAPQRQEWVRQARLLPCPPSALVFRTEYITRAGGSDEELVHGEDIDLLARVAEYGRVEMVMEVLGDHRLHRSSMSVGQARERMPYARWVAERRAARRDGRDLPWTEFIGGYRPTLAQRRWALAMVWYHEAGMC